MSLQNLFGDLALDATLQDILTAINALDTNDVEAILNSILTAVSDLDANTDGIEALLTSAVAALSAIQTNTDDLAAILAAVDGLEALITAGNAVLGDIDTNTDNLETLAAAGNATAVSILAAVDQLEGYLDTVEALIGATNTALGGLQTTLSSILTSVDGLEALVGTTNSTLASILTSVDQLEGYLDTVEALIGATNTALGSLLTATTNGTQKTQIVDGGGQVMDVTATGAALCHLDGNAHLVDVAAWTPFSDSMLMVGGLIAGTTFAGAATIRAGSRAWLNEIVDSAGNPFGTSANPFFVAGGKNEDDAHVSGDRGLFMLGVRNDANAVRTSADGDYSPLSTDNTGRLKVIVDAAAGQATEATQLLVLAAVDQLEGYLDGVEGLLGTGNTTTSSILTAVDQLEGYVDTLEALIAATNAALATGNATTASILAAVDQLEGYLDTVEALITSTNSALGTANGTLTSILAGVDQLEGYLDTVEALIGATNTALGTANTTLSAIDVSTKVATTFTADSVLLVASTATQMPAVAARRVSIKNDRINTANLRFKQANTVSATSGFELSPGQAIILAVDNLSDVWVFSTGANRVSYAVIP